MKCVNHPDREATAQGYKCMKRPATIFRTHDTKGKICYILHIPKPLILC